MIQEEDFREYAKGIKAMEDQVVNELIGEYLNQLNITHTAKDDYCQNFSSVQDIEMQMPQELWINHFSSFTLVRPFDTSFDNQTIDVFQELADHAFPNKNNQPDIETDKMDFLVMFSNVYLALSATSRQRAEMLLLTLIQLTGIREHGKGEHEKINLKKLGAITK